MAADFSRTKQTIAGLVNDPDTVEAFQVLSDKVLSPIEQLVRMREHDLLGGGDAPGLDLVK